MTLRPLLLATVRPHGRAALLLSCLAMGMPALVHAAGKALTHTVVIEGVQFAPATVDAKVGDTVVWMNKDPFPHTATSPGRFDSGTIRAGAPWRFKVKSKGSFAYICTLHPNMKATLVVR